MIHRLNIVLALSSVAVLVAVYGLKYSVEEVAKSKTALERQIVKQQGQLSLLKADWS
jgi:hypothetical protein